MTIQGHLDELSAATESQPGDLRGPRPGLTGLEKSSKDCVAIYEFNRITAAKVKRMTHKSQAPTIHNAKVCVQICPVGHIVSQCSNELKTNKRPMVNVIQVSTTFKTMNIPIAGDHTSKAPQHPTITVTYIIPLTAPRLQIRRHTPPPPPTLPLPRPLNHLGHAVRHYLQHHRSYHRTWGIDHNLSLLRSNIHLTHWTGQALPNQSHRDRRASAMSTSLTYLNCPHCPCAFTYTMGLQGYMRLP
ncbi:unnamed protein product [Schistocephalus solidus]|uniref:Uncharacterized protein n=1 Tax=Schistocephalus solidus TaxID=70667 RepID=A0A183SIT0_SCHSO|nr:unnamed protein product [Schistocephalus solidus]